MKLKLFLVTSIIVCSSAAYGQGENYWQQRVEYEMDIVMDVARHQFSGTQKLTYFNNSPDTLNRVFYHLYFNAFQPGSMMDVRSRTIADPDSRVGDRIYHLSKEEIGYQKINSLEQDGESVEYIIDGTILEVTLAEPILPGKSTVFEMEFNGQVPLQIRRSGWNSSEGVEFSMSQWYPKISQYDDMGWHPNPYIGREFYGVWGDFDVKITIDSSYVMGATGILKNPEEIGHGYQQKGSKVNRPNSKTLTWHWIAENVHDFMWAADPDFVHTTAQVPGGPMLHFLYQDSVVATETHFPREELIKNWKQLPEYTVKAFQYMNKRFGQYPYEKFYVIQGGDGGMEYPMGTLITGNRSLPSLVGVTVHELVHSWYYGVLASNENRFPWMDEGFTTYASSLIMDHLFAANSKFPHQGSYNSYFNIVNSGMEEALDTHADHFHTNRAYGAASYSKGAVFLNQLRYVIGNETFNRGMIRYYNTWKFKHPTGKDFIRVMEKESGIILDWYYEYFINTTKTIDYGVTAVLGNGKNTYVTLERHELMPMPVDVMVTYADGSQELFYIPLRIMRGEKEDTEYPANVRWTTKEDWPWVNPTYTLKIPRPASAIERIEIDPSMRMADINRENNTLDVKAYMSEFDTK